MKRIFPRYYGIFQENYVSVKSKCKNIYELKPENLGEYSPHYVDKKQVSQHILIPNGFSINDELFVDQIITQISM